MLHGFAQNAECWGPLREALEIDHTLLLPDLPGHGRSPTPRSLEEAAPLLAEALGPAVIFGYSLGARAALQVALRAPSQVQGLILLGGTPGLATEAERAARRQQDEVWAKILEEEGLERFFERWFEQPILADVPRDRRFEEARRRNDPRALAAALRLLGTGAQASLWDQLPGLDMPVLLLTGERDAKFTAIAEQMQRAIGPRATHQRIPGAGHAAHLTAPEEVAAAIRAFRA